MIEDKSVEVIRTNPAQRATYRSLLESTVLKNGVKVVVADKECGITFHRRRNREERAEVREKGFLETKRYININADACEHCLVCTRATGCPGLTFTETDFGRKVQTDLSWCVNDTACTKLDACPAFEEIIVVRSQKPLSRLPDLDKDRNSPARPARFRPRLARLSRRRRRHGHRRLRRHARPRRPSRRLRRRLQRQERPRHPQRRRLLAHHFSQAGLQSRLADHSLRQGRSHARHRHPRSRARARSQGQSARRRPRDPRHHQPAEDADHQHAARHGRFLRRDARGQRCARTPTPRGYFSADVSQLSERVFGTKLYANVIMLGIAFQRGELPLSLDSLEYGIQETMGSAATENWLAFKLGPQDRPRCADRARPVAADEAPITTSSRKNRRG